MVLSPPDSQAVIYERIKRSVQSQATAGFYQLSFQAMNTACRVSFRCLSPGLAADFKEQVVRWVAAFEARYSRFLPDSLISRINNAAGQHWVEVDDETERIFNLCHEMVFFTRGVFDPTALPLARLWNWKANPLMIPKEPEVRAALQLVGWRKVQRRSGGIFLPEPGMGVDLGGIGKEYAVDYVLALALRQGIDSVLVDFGQDVRGHGQPPEKGAWHVGLEDPQQPGRCWTGVAITDHAVATSGDYVRCFRQDGRRYGHILDPRSGYPVNNSCLAVSVIAPYCTLAGIVSTAAFILGPKGGLNLMSACPGVEGCITTETARNQSRGFLTYATS